VMEFYGNPGQIENRYLDLWASDLVLALIPRSNKKASELKCAVGHFDVSQGRAETKSLLVDMERIVIKGVGSVDLNSERLNLLVWPDPRDPALISLTTPVRITGTLAAPKVSPQARGVVEDVAWLIIGANNPFVLLLGYLKPSDIEGSPCSAALAGFEGEGKTPVNKPPSALNKTTDFIRGIGRFLQRSIRGG